jgi:subtilisin family serine protease
VPRYALALIALLTLLLFSRPGDGIAPALAAVPAQAGAAERATDAAAPDGDVSYERVEVTALVAPSSVVDFLERLGAVIEVRSHDRVQALVPRARVSEVAAAQSILRVEPAATAIPFQLPTAVDLIGATRWGQAGFTGYGVRVAVIDTGFEDYQARLGTTLPERLIVRSFRADGVVEGGIDHGTRAAEIVHRVAPRAEIYLLSFGTVTELSAVIDFVVERRLEVVSFSLGFIHSGPGDGTGPVDQIVSRGVAGGAIWTVAAGNWAEQHWSGAFTDSDGDSVHEFDSGSSQNGRQYEAGDLIIVSLRWNDEWGAACSDYDLELFGPSGSLIRASRGIQNCAGDPVEGLQVLATESGTYSVRLIRASDDQQRELDLLFIGSPGRGNPLDVFVAGGSLSEPADHPGVITVGAVSIFSPFQLSAFSSRGPTTDGRAKPELSSPTSVLGTLQGGESFAGTSAAAPHAAGVAALVIEALPTASATQIRQQLLLRAVVSSDAGSESSPVLLANAGSLAGLGLLLPAGADEARVIGALPSAGGIASIIYVGPDGYPLRFGHLLTGQQVPTTWFRFDVDEQRWNVYVVGAPAFVNSFEVVSNGDVLFAQLAAPLAEALAAGTAIVP